MDQARGNDLPWKPDRSPLPFREPGPPAEPLHAEGVTRAFTEGEWLGHLYERLLAKRVILAHGRVDDPAATTLTAQLLTLDAEAIEPIHLQLRVSVTEPEAAVTLIDVLDQMLAPVCATVLGEIGGASLAVLAAAPLRRAAPHATFRLVEPCGRLLKPGMTATAAGLGAEADRRNALLDILYGRIAARAGKAVDEVRRDAQQKRYLTAVEALEYGLADEIAVPPPNALM
jgi:ATP-dependent Clp protease protease subunit